MTSSFDVSERWNPYDNVIQMLLKDLAEFSVKEMAICGKCSLSLSDLKPSKALLILGINSKLRIAF